jgi:hypothetical protein
MIFDLDCKLSGGRDDETFNAINFRRLLTVFLSLLKLQNAQVKDWNSETERLSLTCSCSNHHINVGL